MAYPVTLNGRTYTLADFEGTNYVDGLPDAFEDFVTHAGDIYNDTSTSSVAIGTGSKTFTVSSAKPYQAGTPLRIADSANPETNFLDCIVTSYSGTTLVVNAFGYAGSGTIASWTINIGGAKTVDGTLAVSQGGTGATTASDARTNLDVYSKADADSRFLNVSGEASNVTMTGDVTIGDTSGDTLTVNATATFANGVSFGDNVISGDDIDGGTISNFASTGIDDNATSTKLTVSDSGIDVTGTVTSDGLTVDGDTLLKGSGTNTTPLKVFSDNSATNNTTTIEIGDFTGGGLYEIPRASLIGQRSGSTSGGILTFTTGESSAGTLTKRITIDSNGDISFYEDTGTSQAFFWDASAESLGIGTTSPSSTLHLYGTGSPIRLNIEGTTGRVESRLDNTSGAFIFGIDDSGGAGFGSAYSRNIYSNGAYPMLFWTNNAERMRVDSSGNVGIGTTSPSANLDVVGSSDDASFRIKTEGTLSTSDAILYMETGGTTGENLIFFGDADDNGVGQIRYDHNTDSMEFRTTASERMRIDSSGNLLVGHAGSIFNNINATSTIGSSYSTNGEIFACSDESSGVMILNRKTTDGNIASFRKDGTTLGSIKSRSSGGNLQIDTVQSGIDFSGDGWLPMRNGSIVDNDLDLGSSSFRFDDIYATNDTIQTSDANEKQDIEALSDAETRVAVAAKGLLRKFRWKSAVEEKGDDARIHFGIIAQDLQAAFEAEGLDAGRYAMFIHSTWTDEETGEERSRMGVRYSELLAFIIAAI